MDHRLEMLSYKLSNKNYKDGDKDTYHIGPLEITQEGDLKNIDKNSYSRYRLDIDEFFFYLTIYKVKYLVVVTMQDAEYVNEFELFIDGEKRKTFTRVA
ncbi:MAG: hypothetical protein ABIN67_03480 [Ferruginibacter sp.]